MSNAFLTLEQIQADVAAVIQAGLDWHPDLWWGGVFIWHDERKRGVVNDLTPEQRLALYRDETKREWGTEQVVRAAQFIAQAPRTKTPNMRRGTYGWKHVAERWHRLHPTADGTTSARAHSSSRPVPWASR